MIHVGYGAFPGGDPRKFTPDPEVSTPAEMEAWRRACAVYASQANPMALRQAHEIIRNDQGEMVMHIAHTKFGLGTYEFDDGEPDCERCLDAGVIDTGEPSDAGGNIFRPCPDCSPDRKDAP